MDGIDRVRKLQEEISEYDREIDNTHIEMDMYELFMKRAITLYKYHVEETLRGLEERSESEFYEHDLNYWYNKAREAVRDYNNYRKKYGL